MEYRERALNACTEALRAAEMRQGCTNHSDYAEILLNELASPDLYEALAALARVYGVPMDYHGAIESWVKGIKALAKAEGLQAEVKDV